MADNDATQAGKPGRATALDQVLGLLDLAEIGTDHYRGNSMQTGWNRVYGGQVLAQAAIAAMRTVGDDRTMHSLHGYFMLAGDSAHPIEYEVDRMRDGASFTTRRVAAIQNGRPIFELMASFHKAERGLAHAAPMPDVPMPEDLPTAGELLARPDARVPDTMRAYYARERAIELRFADPERFFGGATPAGRQRFWLKARGTVPDAPHVHAALLAFASDFAMIDTALIPHGRLMFEPTLQLASLDHAIWLHAPARVDEWLLYELDSPWSGAGRGFARGTFYTRDGRLVATTAQEGLMRERSTAFVIK